MYQVVYLFSLSLPPTDSIPYIWNACTQYLFLTHTHTLYRHCTDILTYMYIYVHDCTLTSSSIHISYVNGPKILFPFLSAFQYNPHSHYHCIPIPFHHYIYLQLSWTLILIRLILAGRHTCTHVQVQLRLLSWYEIIFYTGGMEL